jgi:hypothetical protein
VRELARFHPALHALIGGGIIQKYVDREGAGCFSNTAPSASRRRLDEAGRDLLLLVVQFRDTKAAALLKRFDFNLKHRLSPNALKSMISGSDR